jgi:hypothetical protein
MIEARGLTKRFGQVVAADAAWSELTARPRCSCLSPAAEPAIGRYRARLDALTGSHRRALVKWHRSLLPESGLAILVVWRARTSTCQPPTPFPVTLIR